MPKSPLKIVEERFENKAALVAAVKKLAKDDLFVDQLNEDKGLDRVSNAKLLKLHEALTELKEEHGSRSKLIDSLLALEKRDKDEDYRVRYEAWPTARLLDHYAAAKANGGRRGPSRVRRKKKKKN